MLHSTRRHSAPAGATREGSPCGEHSERERLAARYNEPAWGLIQTGKIREAIALMEEYLDELKKAGLI